MSARCWSISVAAEAQGSGVLIGGSYFLTAEHVVEGQRGIRVRFPSGTYGARILAASPADDVALLALDGKPDLPGCTIAARDEQPGGNVYFAGYCPPGLRVWPARMYDTNYTRPHFQAGGLPLSGSVSGNSGGPGFNSNGEIIGVLNSNSISDTYNGYGTTCGSTLQPVRQIISPFVKTQQYRDQIVIPEQRQQPRQYQQCHRIRIVLHRHHLLVVIDVHLDQLVHRDQKVQRGQQEQPGNRDVKASKVLPVLLVPLVLLAPRSLKRSSTRSFDGYHRSIWWSLDREELKPPPPHRWVAIFD